MTTQDKPILNKRHVQHYFLAIHQLAIAMTHTRPQPDDSPFLFALWGTGMHLLDACDSLDVKSFREMLSLPKPTMDDIDNSEDYCVKVHNTTERILNHIGWPEDVCRE